jgi:hypothetical protein
MMKIGLIAIAVASLIGGAVPAAAATFVLHYTATAGTILPTTADFRIVTSDDLNAIGGYDILSASGSVNGVAIDGLAPIDPPGFRTDNVFFIGGPVFNDLGLGWTSGAATGNLWWKGGTYILGQYDPTISSGPQFFNRTSGDLTVAAVPEPASWALLIIGFGALGSAQRRRRAAAGAHQQMQQR